MYVYCVEALHAHRLQTHQQRRARVEVGEDLCDVRQHQQVLELEDLVRHQRPAHVLIIVIGAVVRGGYHAYSSHDM